MFSINYWLKSGWSPFSFSHLFFFTSLIWSFLACSSSSSSSSIFFTLLIISIASQHLELFATFSSSFEFNDLKTRILGRIEDIPQIRHFLSYFIFLNSPSICSISIPLPTLSRIVNELLRNLMISPHLYFPLANDSSSYSSNSGLPEHSTYEQKSR